MKQEKKKKETNLELHTQWNSCLKFMEKYTFKHKMWGNLLLLNPLCKKCLKFF